MNGLKYELYKTIHRNKIPVKKIADLIGISENYLYRSAIDSEESPSGARFPLELLTPLMKATNNYSVLKYICSLNGFMAIKMPKFKNHKGDEIELVNSYQQKSCDAIKKLTDFFNAPTSDNFISLNDALLDVMAESEKARRYAMKKIDGQMELDL